MLRSTFALLFLSAPLLVTGCSQQAADTNATETATNGVAEAEETTESSDDGWITLFDGETLDGWEANENPEDWTVEDGMIVGRGPRSHLFYTGREFTDVEFTAEIWLRKGSNSGMYFRTEFGPGWPNGYEAQVNNSHGDPVRTGSLYNLVKVTEQLIPDETWWTQTITCQGNHIIIKVNDEVVVDFVDENNTHAKGLLALQQHDPGSEVHYRNLRARPLD